MVFKIRILVAVISHSSTMFRLTKSIFGIYNGITVKSILENIIYKGFAYTFKEVNSKFCVLAKCKLKLKSFIYSL